MTSHGVPRITSTEAKSDQARQKELKSIEDYRSLVDLVSTKIREREYTAAVLAQTSKLLTLNPEYYTIWNYRRLILVNRFSTAETSPSPSPSLEDLSPPNQTRASLIVGDLQFLVPLLRKFPKCYWIWNHRLWLLEQATLLLPASTARRLWAEELWLVRKMLALDSRNFHGWGYRRTVVSHLESAKLAPPPSELSETKQEERKGASMAEEEFAYTTKMIETNLSNFSAWHNRGKLIPRLLEERHADDNARREFLEDEFALITRALYTDPYDQSLWFYHQYLISTLHPSPTQPPILKPDTTSALSYISAELDNIREMLDGAEDCKYIYQALLEYTMLYRSIVSATPPDGRSRTRVDKPEELESWLRELQELDPLRRGRWDDLGRALRIDTA
ncbi:MAG: Rab geranylgeranyltransferase [Candelina submexicana]|nr:MAG: Rab geranylgeranyltransferase [Candelina submexicana]